MHSFQSRLVDLSFPTELILEIIQHLPFGEHTIPTLGSVHPRIKAAIEKHEISITKQFALRQLPHVFTDFPCESLSLSYAWLAQCIHHYDTADSIMATLTSNENHFGVEPHNMALVNAGLLLLYRLSSIESHSGKIAYIESLSRDPLIALWLAIHSAAITGRYYGKGIINQQTYAKGRRLDAGQMQLREVVEFAFAEGALNLGPDFIADVFYNEDGAEPTLMCFYHQYIRSMRTVALGTNFQPLVTEGPLQEPSTSPRSLHTTLLECLKKLYGFNVSMEDLSMGIIEIDTMEYYHPLARLTLSGKARLLQGLNAV